MRTLLITVLAVIVIGGAIWYQKFRFDECIKVGHTRMYCILETNR